MTIKGVEVTHDFECSLGELALYVDEVKARYPETYSIRVHRCEDGGVDISWAARGEKFERIRRITGYLVGTIDRWNDAKQSEERDRVKHNVGGI